MASSFGAVGKSESDFFGKVPPCAEKMFSFKTTAFTGLEFTKEIKECGNDITTEGSFKLSDVSGMDVLYKYNLLPAGGMIYSFTSTFDIAKLARVDGLTVELSGSSDDAKTAGPSVMGKLSYVNDLVNVEMSGGIEKTKIAFPFSVATGNKSFCCGFGGAYKQTGGLQSLLDGLTGKCAYSTGAFGAALNVSKSQWLNARLSYIVSPALTTAVQLKYTKPNDEAETEAKIYGRYKVDKSLTAIAILDVTGSAAVLGLEKALRNGCDLKVGLQLGRGATSLGFNLDVSA